MSKQFDDSDSKVINVPGGPWEPKNLPKIVPDEPWPEPPSQPSTPDETPRPEIVPNVPIDQPTPVLS